MSTFSEVVASVLERAAEVTRLLQETKLPEPSFNEASVYDYDATRYNASDIESLRVARNALINAAQDLSQITMGPVDYLCSLSWSGAKIANLGSLVRLDIPRRIPFGATRKLEDLVAEIGLPERVTTRVIRYAIANGFFFEEPTGFISHTAVSARLAQDRDMHNFCLMWASEITSLLVKLPEALARQQYAGDRAPKAAANLAFPEYLDLFDYFEKRTDAAQRYSTYLASRAKVPIWSADFLIAAWDWTSVGFETVVDVGGSAGSTSILLAKAFPTLRLVSQDIAPEALKEGETAVKDSGLESQISFVQHDFFQPQTVEGKAYIFKSILHDWSDEACIKILKALVPALKAGSHVLIAECLMPDPPARRANSWDFEAKRVEDQIMIAGHGAHERTLGDFQAIFKEANESFRFAGVQGDVGGSVFSLIDFEFTTRSLL